MKEKKHTIRYLILLGLVILFGGLLLKAIQTYYNEDNINPLVKSDTIYVFLTFIILLPIFLFVLVIVSYKEKITYLIEKDETLDIHYVNGKNKKSFKDKSSNEGLSRFYMLNQLDKLDPNINDNLFTKGLDLESICNDFRNYCANKLHLYYDIKDIRRFISSLGVSHILILQGMSGTGKTSLAYAFGEYINNKTVVIPIQPMWKERTDLIGYYNEFTKKFNETTFLEKLYEANIKKDVYITVLDEMNIARIEYYFAEFLSLLELPNPESRYLDVVSDVWPTDPKLLEEGRLKLPVNMYFIGTANNDDSTFAISDKVYDRAMIINLDYKSEPFEGEETDGIYLNYNDLDDLFSYAMETYSISKRTLLKLEKLDEYLIDKFHLTFGNRIMKQIRQYIPIYLCCGGEELDALDDILARKIFRKLESQNPIYVRSEADNLLNFIEELFGSDNMKESIDIINKIVRNS